MRIALGKEVAEASLEGQALAIGEDSEEAGFIALGADRVRVRARGGHLEVNGEPLAREVARFRSAPEALARDAGAVGESPLKVNGTRLRGDVVAIATGEGVRLVNVIALEDYLVGVLGSEMPVSFPAEALKAQAVAARTYALNKKLLLFGQGFYLGSNVISQVYGGLNAEDPRTREAVEATRGQVLTYELQPIEAYFHASCGGRTEAGLAALNRDLPYLRSVSCGCKALPQSNWSLELGERELGSAFKVPSGSRLEVLTRTPTGRVRSVKLGAKSIDAVGLRERLGYQRLKSLDFEVTTHRGGLVLTGHGFGHGAGMCQWGAKLLAERGADFKRILSHYYPNTELQTLY